MTWHDLVLYLIARHAGATAAQAVTRLLPLQWHQDGLAPYIVFEGRKDHGDPAIQSAHDRLATPLSVAQPPQAPNRHARPAQPPCPEQPTCRHQCATSRQPYESPAKQ